MLVAILGLAGCAQTAAIPTTENVKSPEVTGTAVSGLNTADVKVYQTQAQYDTPAGTDTLDVRIALDKDKVVKSLEMDGVGNTHPVSKKFIKLFMDGVNEQVVGKKLADLGQFAAVNGSSLTSTGFNKAIAQIKSDSAK